MRKSKNEKPTTLEEEIVEKSKEYYESLSEEYKEALKKLNEAEEKLDDMEAGEAIERHLKNEAYGFILSEGLLEKFLEYREKFHRTRAQEVLYTMATETDQRGLWIDQD